MDSADSRTGICTSYPHFILSTYPDRSVSFSASDNSEVSPELGLCRIRASL